MAGRIGQFHAYLGWSLLLDTSTRSPRGMYLHWTQTVSSCQYRNFLAWMVGCKLSYLHVLYKSLTLRRQFLPRQRLGHLFPRLGLLVNLSRRCIAQRSRLYRYHSPDVRSLHWYPCVLRVLLRLRSCPLCSIADPQCHPQCRFGLGDYHWTTHRSTT